ncbi:MAG: DUF3604 domain-containing protein [Pseudomonadales bacterium]|jgi:hypothetical protein|nr:DUF3604 domain-containing protein [Pseudomonadales bacterium]MDP6470283.1 DUF3604 domain-containing protein [Pseudomonadales bacterium]MDP6827189.1 DUF3604 domain-containing protein [Pseudomonadales bacterium]MDP6972508.1 DUF3604 domain-containing protein [Pseudomonadales bacterium]|tara:strand:- start:458 stop:2392 length:1935 start_codon:yes stop_codon:yes gene_type:complete
MRKLITLAALLACGCSDRDPSSTAGQPQTQEPTDVGPQRCDNFDETGMPLFGDLHVHTSFSFDAAANQTGATPEDAQAYAQGEAIAFFPIDDNGVPTGSVRIDRPLDFLGVTDHGEFLGERAVCHREGSLVYESAFCETYRANERQGARMLAGVIFTESPKRIAQICGSDGALCREYAAAPWREIQRAANAANQPCKFTSFIAYEYTGTPGGSNYHRNVVFRNELVPNLPVSYIDAPIDSELWAGLDTACPEESGCDYLTIPHNSNLANGRMAPYMNLERNDENKRAYAERRLRREPIMEIFQHKGNSECVNGLSSILGAPDELCDIESVRRMGEEKTYLTSGSEGLSGNTSLQTTRECRLGEVGTYGMLGAGCIHPTDFQRSGLLVGLEEEQRVGLNPVKLGIIASTDTHTATPGGVSEQDWGGAVTGEATPTERLQPGILTSGIDGNPGGLAGVWAKENTRDAIFDAILRREVFGTSGPRIVPRLFAGWALPDRLCDDPERDATAYAQGVPMGSDLIRAANGDKPRLLAYAAKDPAGRNLQALHLIKGWVGGDGSLNTAVLPIVESEEGAATLCALYTDEDFDPAQSAYYYLRVVEPPTKRWHTYDCARTAEAERPEVCSNGAYPEMIREMAWTSPIWYRGG